MNFLRRINWTNTLFLTLTPLVGIIGTFYLIANDSVHGFTVALAIVIAVCSGLTITAGYHRLFSHKSYTTVWPVRLVFLLIGAGTFEGSALEWCTDHRQHHRHTDTDKDPYNIKRGFWYAHMGWLIFLDPSKRDFSNVEDLSADPLVQWQHRLFVPLAVLMGFILPVGLASLWGDPLGGLIIAGALRIAFNHQTTFCINSVCHLFGKHPYEQQTGRDNWITALFTFGEGFHNFHHQFSIDYRNGIRAYHFDPCKWLIGTLAYLGLATDLKRVTTEQIIRYRIHSDENQLLHKAQQHQNSETFLQHIDHFLKPLRDRILQTAEHLHQLEKDYSAMKDKKMEYLKDKMVEYRTHLVEQKKRLKRVRAELKNSLIVWTEVVQRQNKLAIPMSTPDI